MLIPVPRLLMCGLMTLICCDSHVFITVNSNNQEAPYTIFPVATCLYWYLVISKEEQWYLTCVLDGSTLSLYHSDCCYCTNTVLISFHIISSRHYYSSSCYCIILIIAIVQIPLEFSSLRLG